jgi:hypothetical protein
MIDPTSIELPRFLANWHGMTATSSRTLPEKCEWLPEPLKNWYNITTGWTSPIVNMKRMLPPEQIKQTDGKAVFMKDPTGDWLWAFDVEDMTTVYDAELHTEWERTAESLSEFLIHNACNETISGAENWRECTQVAVELVPKILTPMTEVAFSGWRWPRRGGRVFMSETLLAEVGPAMKPNAPWEDRPGYAEVRVAAIESTHLAYLDEMTSIDWIGSR